MLCLYNCWTNVFFKSIIGLNQIFWGGQLLFFRLNFENIKIIIYIFKKISKFWGGTVTHSYAPDFRGRHIREYKG